MSWEFEKKTPSTTSSSAASSIRTLPVRRLDSDEAESHILLCRDQSPPPQYPASEVSSSHPPPFSSLFSPPEDAPERTAKFAVVVVEAEASGSTAAPAYESADSREDQPFDPSARAFHDPVAETKRALPQDTKGENSRKDDDAEPPPAYSEGDSPLLSFSYLMAAAGGASSIITQVQQGGPPVNTLGG